MHTALRDRLATATLQARRDRDAPLVAALRSARSALDNAEAVPAPPRQDALEDGPVGVGATDAPRRALGAAEEATLVEAEIAELRAAATTYDDLGSTARAAEARRVADALAEVLDP